MIRIVFHSGEGRLTGVTVQGHSGYGPAGADIVCAAVTGAVRFLETTVNEVLGLCAAVRIREEDAFVSLRLPGGLSAGAEDTCQALLAGMMVYLTQLRDEYPENIEVLEEESPSP